MKHNASKATWPLILLLGFLSIQAYAEQGNASDDISLTNIDGSKDKLSDYIGHGKWVVLNIWGTRCPPCLEEMPELVRFHDEHHNKDAIVVGIAIDFPSFGHAKLNQVAVFSEDYFIDFPVLLSDASVTERLGLGRLEALPSTYIFSPEGNFVAKQIGAITQNNLESLIAKIINKQHIPNKSKK